MKLHQKRVLFYGLRIGLPILSAIGALFFFAMYLVQDAFHLGIFLTYFVIPDALIRLIKLLPFSSVAAIRMFNLFCILFLPTNALFALTFFLPGMKRRVLTLIVSAICLYAAILLIIYDPIIYSHIYIYFYNRGFTPLEIEKAYYFVQNITRLLNHIILIACLIPPFIALYSSLNLRALRVHTAFVCFSYTIWIILYNVFFERYPCLMVKYAASTSVLRFRALAQGFPYRYYRYMPMFFTVLLILLIVSLVVFIYNNLQLNQYNTDLKRTIHAVNVSSSLFCHYMKNEILAISSDLEFIYENPKKDDALINELITRCDTIYKKLDGIHKSMRDNSLSLSPTPIDTAVENALATLSEVRDLSAVNISYTKPASLIEANIDLTHFEHALFEFLINAVDALSGRPIKNIEIQIRSHMNRVIIRIADTGCGILPENIEHIFTPLFTSKHLGKNWGIGLSNAHKVITAHGGSILTESKLDVGTVFEIILPIAYPM